MFLLKPYKIIKTDITTLKFHIPKELKQEIYKWLWYVEMNFMVRDESSENEFVPETFNFRLNWTRNDFEKQYDLSNQFLKNNGKQLSEKWKYLFLKRPHLQLTKDDIIVYLIDSDLKEWFFWFFVESHTEHLNLKAI